MKPLVQQYQENLLKKQEELRLKKEAAPRLFAKRLRSHYTESAMVAIREQLVRTGYVVLKQTPCSCQEGSCEDTKGFQEYLQDWLDELKEEGICVHFGIDQTFYLETFKLYPTHHWSAQLHLGRFQNKP